MATTGQRRTSNSRQPYFHADDFVGTKLYDRDREADDRWRQDMSEKIDKILEQLPMIVSRAEHQRKWDEYDRRFSVLEQRIDVNYKDMENKLNAANTRTGAQFLSNANQSTYWLLMVVVAVIGGVAGHFIH